MSPIAAALASTRAFLTDRGETRPAADPAAIATLVSGLRCRVDTDGKGSFATDMPERIGGTGVAPSPGQYLRGAAAACMATAIAMSAADHEVELESLVVTVGSRSDGLAFFGLTDGKVEYADLEIAVEVAAPAASTAQLDDVIEYARAHAPVGLSIERPVPTTVTWRRTGE